MGRSRIHVADAKLSELKATASSTSLSVQFVLAAGGPRAVSEGKRGWREEPKKVFYHHFVREDGCLRVLACTSHPPWLPVSDSGSVVLGVEKMGPFQIPLVMLGAEG